MSKREHWGSRIGFILAAAGSAVGLGNIWRFPYVTGTNGGAAFLLIYLAVALVLGLSLAIAEMTLGRAAQKNAVGAFRMMGGAWWAVGGYMAVCTCVTILPIYAVVAGWTIAYVGLMSCGTDAAGPAAAEVFGDLVSDPVLPLIYSALFIALTAAVVCGGVRRGIERWNRILMPGLFILLSILAVRALTLPGAGKGLAFYLVPDWSEVSTATFRNAVAQAFFSLSVGMGVMLTYGSYLRRDENVPSAALTVVILDIAAAFLAGLCIMPAVFAYGLNPEEGPGLAFVTLPIVFSELPLGSFFGVLFFLLLGIAALTSAVSCFESIVAYVVEEHHLSRGKAVWGVSCATMALSIPASWSFGKWKSVTIHERTFFDVMDLLVNNVMLPIGGLTVAIFVGWVWNRAAVSSLSGGAEDRRGWLSMWISVLRMVVPACLVWTLVSAES